MPVEETVDLDTGLTTSNLDKLDKMSAKAAKQLEKQRKALEKAQQQQEKGGGIFGTERLPGSGAPSDIQPLTKEQKQNQRKLRKLQERIEKERAREIERKERAIKRRDQKIEKKLQRLAKKVERDKVKQFGEKSFLSEIFGQFEASNIFSFGKNPRNFLTGVLKAVPILGGVLAAKEIAEFIVDEIARIDRFFKVFIDEVDNRIDRFRSLQDQADIQAGLQQRIITTSFGTTEPRYAYNSFEEYNNNRRELEERFQMTNNSGVE